MTKNYVCVLPAQSTRFLSGFPGIYRIFPMFLNTLIRLDKERIIEVNFSLLLSAYQSDNNRLFKRIREIILSVCLSEALY